MTLPLSTVSVSVRQTALADPRAPAKVLAWARANQSLQLRYIGELTEHERGDACDCSCISCGQPLQAVNAARPDGQVRQHFRHRAVADHRRCQIKSARAAFLARLDEGDVIVLPASRRALTLTGLSGAEYHGLVETGPTTVRVRQRHFLDATTAELRLDDGRRLIVKVVGSAQQTALGAETGGTLTPRIDIVIDDPQVAMLSPEDLRARLFPALGAGLWCGHWPDPEADAVALAQAQAAADQQLDWFDGPDEVPAALRHESVLHREVKAILASASALALPAWQLSDTGRLVTDPRRVERPRLAGARLEKKLGRIIPDVIAELNSGGDLLIEVTVTNTITAERLERIRAVDLPTLEIDFSRMRGVLSRDALRVLVLDQVHGKTWLHHPAAKPALKVVYDNESVLYGWRLTKRAESHREAIVRRPVEDWAADYLAAVGELARIDFVVDPEELLEPEETRRNAIDSLLRAADGLHAHDYPEALDHRLFDDDYQRTVLHRLMSILTGTPVAYRGGTVWQVLNSILAETVHDKLLWHALYLIALKAKPVELTRAQDERVTQWRERVRSSLRSGDGMFRRDSRYDRLFALLFPELLPDLNATNLKRNGEPVRSSGGGKINLNNVDYKYLQEPDIYRWEWATDSRTTVHGLAIDASRARLDGFAVDEDSVLYHLCKIAHTASYVSTVAERVAVRAGTDAATVVRYLCRNGYIHIPSEQY
jgi:hypothetical protein